MTKLDLVIKGGTVVTAADTVRCDIGVRDGRIAVLADNLDDAAQVIDAADRLVLPGGVDSHVHIDEPPFYGVLNADDFESGTISAACGGTTTIVPFAQQERGRSLRAAIQDYHTKAEGKAVIDYAFHVILLDPHEQLLGQEMPALIEDGYTSYKVYMTYEGLVLDDRQILEILEVAKSHGAIVMVHAENDHCIHHLAAKLDRRRQDIAGALPRDGAPAGRARGDPPGDHPGRDRRRAHPAGPRLGGRGDGADTLGARPRPQGLWRDLPAIPFRQRGPVRPARLGRGEVPLRAAAAQRRKPGGAVARHRRRRLPGAVVGPLLVPVRGSGRKEVARARAPFPPHRPRPARHRDAPAAAVLRGRAATGRISLNTSSSPSDGHQRRPHLRPLSAQGNHRGRRSDADIAIWDPENARSPSPTAMLHDAMDYTPYEGFAHARAGR